MRYDISKPTAPKMPYLGKGTECIKILLSQASKDMYEPLVPMFFPVLGAHISGAEFQYPDLTWKELCGMIANLVADSGCNKGQLSNIVEAICRDFREHDTPGERLFLQLKEVLPSLVHYQLPPGCKDFSDYYLKIKIYNHRLLKNNLPLSRNKGRLLARRILTFIITFSS